MSNKATFKRTISHAFDLRSDLSVDINNGEESPRLYLDGVKHNVWTIVQYVDMLETAIKQLEKWYPDWTGWKDAWKDED